MDDLSLVGSPAPPFQLTAVVSQRTISPHASAGRPLVLNFHGHQTATAVADVIIALRRPYPAADRLTIAHIADMSIVPRLMQATAERILETAYLQTAAELPDGYDPAEHLLLLPDWTGQVHQMYRIGDVSRRVSLIVVDSRSIVRGHFHSPTAVSDALTLLAAL